MTCVSIVQESVVTRIHPLVHHPAMTRIKFQGLVCWMKNAVWKARFTLESNSPIWKYFERNQAFLKIKINVNTVNLFFTFACKLCSLWHFLLGSWPRYLLQGLQWVHLEHRLDLDMTNPHRTQGHLRVRLTRLLTRHRLFPACRSCVPSLPGSRSPVPSGPPTHLVSPGVNYASFFVKFLSLWTWSQVVCFFLRFKKNNTWLL